MNLNGIGLAVSTVLLLLNPVAHTIAQQTSASEKKTESTSPGTKEQAINKNKARSSDYTVDVTSVIEKSTPENKVIYQTTYNYEFKGRDTVYIKGLGTVPAKGKFSYLTFEQQLEFRESAADPVITTVQLEETTRTQQGPGSTEFPDERKFPQFFRSSTWTPPSTFPGAALKVIQKYFLSGYNARQGGQVNYYVTTYRSLEVPPESNLRSQVAVVVSQPYDAAGDKFTYRIQFVARDRPRGSTTWREGDDRSQQTITAAQEFINNLITELTTAGGKQQ